MMDLDQRTFPDGFQAKSNAFMHWLSSIPNASISPKISLEDLRNRGAGRGVVATQSIPAEEDLFIIPRASILCVDNSSLPSLLPSVVFADLDPWNALILVLIFEYLQGPASRWKPYFDVLPETFDTLMFWSPEELEELQASAVRVKIGREEADEGFKQGVLPVVKSHADVFYLPGSNVLGDSELLALAHRMGSTIMAYAFDLERDESTLEVDEDGYAEEEDDDWLPKGMVPLADMLNSDAIFNARLYYGADALTMKSLVDIQPGEEILNDYGSLPRSDMLRRYGYITPAYAPFDVAEVEKELLVEAVQKYKPLEKGDLEKRLAYLDDHEVLEDGYDIPRLASSSLPTSQPPDTTISNPVTFPASLLHLLHTLLSPASTYKSHLQSTTVPPATLTTATHRLLLDALRIRLQQYSTSAAQDAQLLRNGGLTGRRRMAVEVRLGEKECLKGGMDEAARVVRIVEESSMRREEEEEERSRGAEGRAGKRRRMA